RSGRNRVGAGKAVAQQNLRDAETVDDSDGHLEAALAAIRQRCLCQILRQFGAQRLVGHDRFLGCGWASENANDRCHGQQITNDHEWSSANVLAAQWPTFSLEAYQSGE